MIEAIFAFRKISTECLVLAENFTKGYTEGLRIPTQSPAQVEQKSRQKEQTKADVLCSAHSSSSCGQDQMPLPWGYTERWNARKSPNTPQQNSPQHRAINHNSQQQINPRGDIPTIGNSFFALTTRTFHTNSPVCSQRTPLQSWRKAAQNSEHAQPRPWSCWILALDSRI